MEVSHQLLQPNDSFSYAWLIDVKSSSSAAAAAAVVVGDSRRSHDDGAGSFIEIDPDGFFSMRWSTSNDGFDFDFSLPPPQCSDQVHADQIFSGGHLLPLLDRQRQFAGAVTPSARRLTESQSANSNRFDSPRRICAGSSTPGPAKSSSSAKKTARKYFCFLTPLYKTVKDLMLVASSSSSSFTSSFSSSSSSSSSSSFKSASTGKDSARSSPRSSNAMSSADLCRGSNADISVNDAILHCKKSIVSSN
ncbi:hypothetical protein ZIOFF_002816 [Zingiber officinale]|uniref:Uncharacterized protein n=1 Tax=Zingiber officinale TaxID=94328 RepID=A0A8J5LZD7_ZINOF|nr:hypothetical protein ZIOFF_002816 [Zingiber officinale]